MDSVSSSSVPRYTINDARIASESADSGSTNVLTDRDHLRKDFQSLLCAAPGIDLAREPSTVASSRQGRIPVSDWLRAA